MFKIESGIPVPSSPAKKAVEIAALKETISKMTNGQSTFVESNIISNNSVRDALKSIRESYTDRKIVIKEQSTPIKGTRIWVKFYNPEE